MRILHVNNQASVAYLLSRAQRKLGHRSDLLAVRKATQRPPDFEASDTKGVFLKLLRMAPKYDLIHVHGGIGISGLGLMPFRATGKRFIAHYHGSELRQDIQTSFHRLAETIFVSTPDLLQYSKNLGSRELVHIPNPVFTENVSPVDWKKKLTDIEQGGPVRISHLPTIRKVKGTENVIKAVEGARDKGSNIVLDIIEGVEVAEAMKRLERSHICIDWMSDDYRIHGVVTVEAMLRRMPVICNIDRELYPKDIPVIDVGPAELEGALVDIAARPGDLPEKGEESMRYAFKYHHPDSVAAKVEEYL